MECTLVAPQAGVKSLARPELVVTEESGDVLQKVLKRVPCLVFFFLSSNTHADVQGT